MCPKFPAMGHPRCDYQQNPYFDVCSTMAKCGMKMPREVAISSPGAVGSGCYGRREHPPVVDRSQ